MTNFPIKNLMFGLVGAVAGGFAGMFVSDWMKSQGFYSPIIPAALVGLGFGLAARKRNVAFGVISMLLGGVFMLLSEWRCFNSNASFPEFIVRFKDEGTVTFVLFAIGLLMAFSFGKGRENDGAPSPKRDNS